RVEAGRPGRATNLVRRGEQLPALRAELVQLRLVHRDHFVLPMPVYLRLWLYSPLCRGSERLADKQPGDTQKGDSDPVSHDEPSPGRQGFLVPRGREACYWLPGDGVPSSLGAPLPVSCSGMT